MLGELTLAYERAQKVESDALRLEEALGSTTRELEELKLSFHTQVEQLVDERRKKLEKDLREENITTVNEKVRKAMATVVKEKEDAQRILDDKIKLLEQKYSKRLNELEEDSGDKARAKLADVQAA